uniref:Organic cation transporter protein-like n=2 Tax=Hirondellea gigas TaxID=1518452 RepID=A0A6A7G4B2_9CRUS
MLGMLVGAISLGDLADRIGRRNGLVVSCAILGVSGLASAVAPNFPVFLISRMVSGAGAVGLFQVTFVLAVEFIGSKYRTFVGIMIETPFALGEAMAGVLAYFIRDWRYLQLAITLPAFLLISYRWLMPESIRWLVSQNRTEEAIVILKKVAKVNNKKLQEEKLDFIRDHAAKEKSSALESIKTSGVDLANNEKIEQAQVPKVHKKSVLDLLRTPNMRKRSLNMFFCWAVVTFMYYGLSLNSGNMGSNIFVSFILTMLIEIPSYLFAWFALDRMGRKGTLMFMFWLAGISCIIAGVLDREYSAAIMVLSLLGKFGAAAAFAIVYVYASEIFPTDYRSVGVGACSMFARVGGMLAPFIVELFRNYPAVSPVIFGVLGCMCGISVTLLPETVGCRLPQNLAESEAFGSDQSIWDCCFCITNRKRNRNQR